MWPRLVAAEESPMHSTFPSPISLPTSSLASRLERRKCSENGAPLLLFDLTHAKNGGSLFGSGSAPSLLLRLFFAQDPSPDMASSSDLDVSMEELRAEKLIIKSDHLHPPRGHRPGIYRIYCLGVDNAA